MIKAVFYNIRLSDMSSYTGSIDFCHLIFISSNCACNERLLDVLTTVWFSFNKFCDTRVLCMFFKRCRNSKLKKLNQSRIFREFIES
jgi:hypothetical protein